MKLIYFFKYINNEQKKALISKYNATYRFLDAFNKEHFFSTFTQAVKYALDNDYIIENLFDSVDASRLRDSKR